MHVSNYNTAGYSSHLQTYCWLCNTCTLGHSSVIYIICDQKVYKMAKFKENCNFYEYAQLIGSRGVNYDTNHYFSIIHGS